MEPEKSLRIIEESVKTPWSRNSKVVLTTFQKLIRKRLVRKKYGSFRVPEYEAILMESKEYSILYAKFVVMGKLPPKLHRKMLAWAIAEPNDNQLKFYFKVCGGNDEYVRPSYWPQP